MKIDLHFILAAALLLAAAACGPAEVEPPESATPTQAAEATPAEAGPLQFEDGKLYVAIIWHQHQPFYFQDPDTGLYERPWVRVHAAKDYVDMAAILHDYPDIRATFNLTPSLIHQLDDLAAGAKDLYWAHTEIAADELTPDEKQFILDRFFDINPGIVERFPRYVQLVALRGEDRAETWTDQDFRDLQVLFNLAWTDPAWLAQEPLASLVEKGRGFSEQDKSVILDEHLRLVREVIPLHAQLQRQGQIEVTMTPLAHPILPLLVDSNLASIALPEAELPTRFVFGQDAVAQLELGVEAYQDHFGMPPRGMWPAEGSVAESIVTMVSNAGIQWMASDEDVLAASLPDLEGFTRDSHDTVLQADALYQPYAVQGARGSPVAIIFRDHLMSDKVGFEYSGTPGEQAAADFVGRLEAIQARLNEEGAQGPHLVTVLLDGENAWEYYENDGLEFLHAMYRMLSESETLVTVTPTQYLEGLEGAGIELTPLEDLWAGSWIDGTFSTWIGEEEENTGWEYLRQTREALQQALPDLTPEQQAAAFTAMYRAEGSDWFWWYGADQNSGSDDSFDRQFRSFLEQVYLAIGQAPPDFLAVPVIPQARALPDQEPLDLLAVTVNGQAAAAEWDNAGRYDVPDGEIEGVYYGFSLEEFFLRIEGSGPLDDVTLGIYLGSPYGDSVTAFSRHGPGETQLGFGADTLIEITIEGGAPSAQLYGASGAGGWAPTGGSDDLQAAVQGRTLEMAVPFAALFPEARSGDRINLRLIVSRAEQDAAVLPGAGPAQASIPDLPIPNVFLTVEDPLTDDRGPGAYTYPSDTVFKAGVFDLAGLTVGYDETEVIFRLEFRGPVINEWGSPNGMSVQTIDIYVDVDGPGSGDRILLPGRNAALTAEHGWDYAIWAEGWTPGIYAPGADGPVQVDSGFSITTNPGQRRVTIGVPRSLIPGDPQTWSLAIVVLSQEGYPSAGVWRVRDVQPQAAQWRIGGGSGSPNDTRILDILWPEGSDPDQTALLGSAAPADVSIADLEPDQLPQVPMITP